MPSKNYRQTEQHKQHRAEAILKNIKIDRIEENKYCVFASTENENEQGFIINGKRVIGHKLK